MTADHECQRCVAQGSASQLQICLVILTREATLWTASLSDSPASKAASASRNATTLTVQTATTVDPKALQATLPVDSSAPAKLVMYGKSICYCATTGMYIASLGNAYDEEQNVTWLLTISNDGPTIAQVSPVHVTSSPSNADSDTESASSAESAGRQHPDPESDAEHAEGGEAEDHHAEGGSDNGSADQTTLPSVERSYAIPVLPVSRQEMQSPGLVLGVPSHGLPGLMATVFEAAHNDGSGCALVSQMHDIEVRPTAKSDTGVGVRPADMLTGLHTLHSLSPCYRQTDALLWECSLKSCCCAANALSSMQQLCSISPTSMPTRPSQTRFRGQLGCTVASFVQCRTEQETLTIKPGTHLCLLGPFCTS